MKLFYHTKMIDILNYIEEHPKETQRLIGLEYSQLHELIRSVENLHNEE